MNTRNLTKYIIYLLIYLLVGLFFLSLLIYFIIKNSEEEDIDLSFSDDFFIGTASSAYQVEGAWNYSDKSESIWDHFTHNSKKKIQDYSNADITADSFHEYKQDVQLLRSLGANHYRFSLSWTRLMPTGYTNKISETGVQYYHNLLDELEKYNITPIVTIYHFDHPQSLENMGGWMNESMIYAYMDYARFVFREYGHRIKYFVTFNEIFVICDLGYRMGLVAPGVTRDDFGNYLCVHNSLKAHALVYHIYDKEFRRKQNGLIGIAEYIPSFYNKYPNDTHAKDIAYAFSSDWILNPIFSTQGNYPEILIRRVAEKSKEQGLNKSRLPTFTDEWINYIRGTADFLGVNYYIALLVEQLSPGDHYLIWSSDSNIRLTLDPSWPSTEYNYNKIFPKGFGDVLRKMKNDYNNPPVYVLESGVAVSGGVSDSLREEYVYLYLKELLIAMKRDKCNIKMYTYWSLLDSFEWAYGYSVHFGLAKVEYKNGSLTRTLKNSASWFRSVIKSRKLHPPINSI